MEKLKPKIFIWQGRFSGGGAEKVTLELANACLRAGLEPVLGAFEINPNFDFQQIKSPSPFPSRLLGYNSVFASLWLRFTGALDQFDIVLAHVEGFWRGKKNIYIAHQAGDIERALGTKTFLSKIIYYPVYLASILGLRRADLIFYTTTVVKDFLMRKKIKATMLPTSSFMDFLDNKNSRQQPQEIFEVLFVGNDQKVKNLPSLIDAVRMDKNINLSIVGVSGKSEGNVSFFGWKEDVNSFYNSADLVCIPSFFEGFPLVSLEALSRGIPVLISEQACPKELDLWVSHCDTTSNSIYSGIKRIMNNYGNEKQKADVVVPIIRDIYETNKVTDREIKNMLVFYDNK